MLRLTLASFGLLLSLPLLFTIHTLWFWKVTLLVGEYGHRLALLTALLAWWCWRGKEVTASLMAVTATGILLTPLLSAAWLAQRLPSQMEAAFGESASGEPLVWKDLWLGWATPKVAPREYQIEATPSCPVVRRLLLYPAASSQPAPVILVVHSGGWQNGSAEEFPGWSSQWATEGYAVVSLEYRLAPKWTWPAPLDDVRDALAYLRIHATEMNVDASRVVLFGRSAGGQIATAAAVQLRDPAIRGAVSLYAPADMVFAHRFADPEDVLDSFKLIGQYMGGDPEKLPHFFQSASATLTADSSCRPMLLVHGQRDILVWHLQSSRLAEHLRHQGVPHLFMDLPWATHAFDYPYHGPGSQLLRYALRGFLKARLGQRE